MKIAITLGDPSGIGPEIVAATLQALPEAERARCVVFGDAGVLARAGQAVGLTVAVDVRAVSRLAPEDAPPGQPTPAGAAAQVAYLEAAVAAACAGEVDALVTAPISKKQVVGAGFAFPGHTEFLAARLGAAEYAMMLAGPRLRVVLATIHIPLAAVPTTLTPERVARAIFLGGEVLARRLGIARPRIGVLGLNPHAGEEGLFGDEEARIVAPGIAAGRARLAAALPTIDALVTGPLVPDAAFRQPYDLFVALYHDQGLIPIKLIDFDLAVNVTLGLPIVRTSPDHGVAYDIAGKGVARRDSFAAALKLATEMTTGTHMLR
jgi:4-hydroxythreonine-4-phosphate dehydrogenase